MADSMDDMPPGEGEDSNVQIQQMEEGEDEPLPAAPEREKWGSKLASFLTFVGYAVGFGNIWRFPYQMRENGGLVFLIPYLTMLAIVGIPVFFLELAVGQRRRKGVIYAWAEISPALGGIGIACGWLCFMVALYYNTLIAYCFSYFVDSFIDPLPWTNCDIALEKTGSDPNIPNDCDDKLGGRATKYYWFRGTLDITDRQERPGNYSWPLFGYLALAWIMIYLILLKGTKSVGIVVYITALFPYLVLLIFFIANCAIEPARGWLGAYRLLKPNWRLLYNPITWLKAGSQIFFSLGLAQGCLVVFASYNPARNDVYRDAILISVINCSTSMFAALVVFPMIGLLGHRKYEECVDSMAKLFTAGSTQLKKFSEDKKYDIYFFTDAKTWNDIVQMPITIRYGYGDLASKEMKDDYAHYFDEEKTEVINSLSSLILPPMQTVNSPVSLRDCSIGLEATASGGGTGFVFLAFTEAVKHIKGSNFWSVLFFLMLIMLGIDSGFGTVEGVIAALEDITHYKRWVVTSIVCGVMMVLALLIFPFGWGSFALDLMDQWTANWTLLVIALLECISIAWSYGLAKISYDIRLMTGSKPNLYILLCWKYISPICISILLIGSIIQFIISFVNDGGIYYTAFDPKDPGSSNGDLRVQMPPYILAVGLCLMIFCIVWVPVHFFLRKTKYNFLKQQAPADFPEEELRGERDINVFKEEEQFTSTEKKIMGKQSLQNLQEHRDRTRGSTGSTTSIAKQRKSSDGISLGGS